MRGVIGNILIVVVTGLFTVVEAQLPPDIMVDRHLVQVERLLTQKDHASALDVMKKIIALQQEHNLTLPDEFHFKYAQVAFLAGLTEGAIDSVNKYLAAAGREGEFYREALELLDKMEQIHARLSDAPKCAGEEALGTECWMVLANQPKCHVWNNFLLPGRETVTWTGGCSGALAQGTGTLRWVRFGDTTESTGHLQGGKRHGNWKEHRADGVVAEGPYMDDKQHGDWKIIDPDDGRENSGRIQELSFEHGFQHGLATISWPDGQTLVLPYERGSINGRSVRRYADGSKTVGDFVDSEEDGVWKHYRPHGSIWKEETYSQGKLHGPYYELSKYCKSEGNYVEGQKDGEWMECSFRREEEGSYVKGLKQGRWDVKHYGRESDGRGGTLRERRQGGIGTEWYEAGKATGVWTYERTYITPRMRDIWPCFNKSKTPYVDGKQHGETIIRDVRCKCWSEVYENGEQVSRKEEWKSRCRRELDS